MHGFFQTDKGMYAVVQWLELAKSASSFGFPFDSWKREYSSVNSSNKKKKKKKQLSFDVVDTETITGVSFVVQDLDNDDHFWVVPEKSLWLLFNPPLATRGSS